MSNYNSQLQSNNADLQAILEVLQNKAAGGGGGDTPEVGGVCPSITIDGVSSLQVHSIIYSQNGSYCKSYFMHETAPFIIENVDVGTVICISANAPPWPATLGIYTNLELIYDDLDDLDLCLFKCTSTSPAAITFGADD
jgi:hypothetical protein